MKTVQKTLDISFHSSPRIGRSDNAMEQIHTSDSDTNVALANKYESQTDFREAFKKWFGQTTASAKNSNEPMKLNRILTPIGTMLVAADSNFVSLLEFADRGMLETQLERVQKYFQTVFAPGTNPLIRQLESELKKYFAGKLKTFTVPLKAPGTEFQSVVWKQLTKIPYGQTRSYDQLAKKIGKPKAHRAVGTANGNNRMSIVIPCHRVIRSNGSISGYGGGVWRKQWLLDHEAKHNT